MNIAIEEMYDKIYRFCYYKVGDRQLAEDITQETFLKFLQSGYDEQGKALHYLYSIARNLCVDQYRRQNLETLSAPEEAMPEVPPFEEAVIEKMRIQEALDKLTEKERELLILRYVNEESLSSICEIMEISRFALYRKLNAIKRKLQKILGGELE